MNNVFDSSGVYLSTYFGLHPFVFGFVFLLFMSYLIYRIYQDNKFIHDLLDAFPQAVIVFDRNFHYTFVNSTALRLLGKHQDELLNRHITQVFGNNLNQAIYLQMKRALKDNQSFSKTYYSKPLKSHINASFHPYENGISVFIEDIGEKTRVQKRLETLESNFLRLIDSNIVGVAIENIEGAITYANAVFLSLIGYTKEDLKKKKLDWKKLTPSKFEEIDNEKEKILFKKGSIKPYEKEYIRKDGSIVPVLKGGVVLSKIEKTSIIFVIDISDRKEIEKRKDDFISIASHEFKTPITSIKGFTQLLLHKSLLMNDKRSADYLNRMLNQTNRLTYLVNDILDVRKIQEGKLVLNKEFFDINILVKDVAREIHMISPYYKINIKADSKTIIFADYYRIYQALLNIMTNAVKYSSESDPVDIAVKRDSSVVRISVSDKGIGIPPLNHKQIFDKFFRLNRGKRSSYPGLGLGLYITSDIITRHNGKIWVESPLYEEKNNDGSSRKYGSTFHITLPIPKENMHV